MGFLDSIYTTFGFFKKDKSQTPINTYVTLGGGGVTVNQSTVLTLSAVFNALDIISNDIALLPKSVHQKTDKGRIKQSAHPVNYLISKQPNNLMTAFSFHKALMLSALYRGNGVAIIHRNKLGYPESLELVTSPVVVIKHEGNLYYKIDDATYHSTSIIHIPGFSFNGITGKGFIEYAAESLGVPLNAQHFAGDYYSGKAQGIGIVETDKAITDKNQKQQIETAVTGSLNAVSKWRVPVLDDGMKFKQIKLTAEEVKFVDSAKFGIEEVARWLNIATVKIKSLSDASYNNIETLSNIHIQDTMMPWVVKMEQEYNIKLFARPEIDNGIYTRFNVNSLLRSSIKDRAEYYSKMAFNGIYTRDEIRELEDKDKIGGVLSEPLTPVNTQTPQQIQVKIDQAKKLISDGKK